MFSSFLSCFTWCSCGSSFTSHLCYKVQDLNRANSISIACLLSFEQGIVLALLYTCNRMKCHHLWFATAPPPPPPPPPPPLPLTDTAISSNKSLQYSFYSVNLGKFMVEYIKSVQEEEHTSGVFFRLCCIGCWCWHRCFGRTFRQPKRDRAPLVSDSLAMNV